MKFKINIGGNSYYKTDKEIPDFAKEIPSINLAVNNVVNALVKMNKTEKLGSGDSIDSLEYIQDGIVINVVMER